MTIATLIRDRLDETGQSKTKAAGELGVTRMTLDHWLGGLHTPEPDAERIEQIARWSGESHARVLAMILLARGIDVSVFEDLAVVDLSDAPVAQVLELVGRTDLQIAA